MSVAEVARIVGLGPAVSGLLLAGAVLLAIGSVVRGTRLLLAPDDTRRERLRSLGSWWLLFLATAVLLVLGPVAVLIAMLLVSLVLLRESLRLTDTGRHFPTAAILVGGLYVGAWMDARLVFAGVFPVLAVALLAIQLVPSRPHTAGDRAQRSSVGFLLSLMGPGYVVAVAAFPDPPGEPLGWLVLLLVLTELNDIAQAWWGRAVGRHRLAPRLSPGKTWEGLAGGLATTALVSVAVAPLITTWGRTLPDALAFSPPGWLINAGLGLTIGLAGLAGDLAASSLKRSAGVKDSGRMLPGQGGLLDRFDSLAGAAPLFFVLTTLVQRP